LKLKKAESDSEQQFDSRKSKSEMDGKGKEKKCTKLAEKKRQK